MHGRRPRPAALWCLLAALAGAGCASAPEHAVLSQFFAAARLRDHTALGAMATADFDPATQGTVLRFQIESVETTPRTPGRSVDADRALASLSLHGTGLDVPAWSGDWDSRDVTVAATVRMPGGATVEKLIVATLERAVIRGERAGEGRWIVTAIHDNAGRM